ncbi:ribosomal biogenesis factor isoform X1 [Varanus komodoensis]|uniref:ribosomal biogenesis factor isoform X1 n=1 Tax=Varanus komodoensis TaxID=61221 RepID=UPI001CF7CA1B|nr:ribosomal biogenesis factor isoform X1 [Varanus komodoensis]
MGKNKAKSQMQKNVFHVANKRIMKAKSKAKPVTTSLKKINIVNDEKVNMVNKIFTEVQKEVKQLSKAIPSDPSKRNQLPKALEVEPANVDAAAKHTAMMEYMPTVGRPTGEEGNRENQKPLDSQF